MKRSNNPLRRISYGFAALVATLGSFMTILLGVAPHAFASTQVTSRSVEMSSSSNAASAATTQYTITFTSGQSSGYLVKGIVVDFCGNSPIIGDTTCTAPTSFSVGASPTLTSTSGGIGASGWSATSLNTNRTLVLTNTTGATIQSSSGANTIVISNIQNPTNAVPYTFYARIYTYTTTTGATGYTVANPDNTTVHTDDGGVAMATANQITVTAKVQETLLFCVYTSGANCAGGTVAGMVLGDSFGVLSSTTTAYLTSTNATTPLTAKLGLASNATTGVTVRAKASGTLTSGSNTIAAIGNTCTADSTTATVEQFGFSITAGSGQTGVTYNCSAGNHAFNTTNLTGTYGDTVLTTPGATTEAAATIDFEGKASTTTKSGVYTSTMTFIATGTY